MNIMSVPMIVRPPLLLVKVSLFTSIVNIVQASNSCSFNISNGNFVTNERDLIPILSFFRSWEYSLTQTQGSGYTVDPEFLAWSDCFTHLQYSINCSQTNKNMYGVRLSIDPVNFAYTNSRCVTNFQQVNRFLPDQIASYNHNVRSIVHRRTRTCTGMTLHWSCEFCLHKVKVCYHFSASQPFSILSFFRFELEFLRFREY